jgi:hypothetical protein
MVDQSHMVSGKAISIGVVPGGLELKGDEAGN